LFLGQIGLDYSIRNHRIAVPFWALDKISVASDTLLKVALHAIHTKCMSAFLLAVTIYHVVTNVA